MVMMIMVTVTGDNNADSSNNDDDKGRQIWLCTIALFPNIMIVL